MCNTNAIALRWVVESILCEKCRNNFGAVVAKRVQVAISRIRQSSLADLSVAGEYSGKKVQNRFRQHARGRSSSLRSHLDLVLQGQLLLQASAARVVGGPSRSPDSAWRLARRLAGSRWRTASRFARRDQSLQEHCRGYPSDVHRPFLTSTWMGPSWLVPSGMPAAAMASVMSTARSTPLACRNSFTIPEPDQFHPQ